MHNSFLIQLEPITTRNNNKKSMFDLRTNSVVQNHKMYVNINVSLTAELKTGFSII